MYILQDYDRNLEKILNEGFRTSNRTGIDCLTLFGLQGRYRIDEYFPIPTKRKYAYKSIFAELLWMLSGSTNVNDLEEMGSKIWSAWKDPEFEKRNNYKPGSLGPIYGWSFRNFGGEYSFLNSATPEYQSSIYKPTAANIRNQFGFDQVSYVIDELQKNKNSRRILINLWDPRVMTSNKVKLPCCHYSFQLCVDDKDRLTGILSQRSGDWLPGISANIFFYSAFMYMIGQQVGLQPYELIHNVGNAHIYENQLDAVNEYLKRPEIDAPKLKLNKAKDIFSYKIEDFMIENYEPGPTIKVPIAV